MTVPPLRVLFDVSVLNIYEWLAVAALALAPIAFSELGKAIGGKERRNDLQKPHTPSTNKGIRY